MPNKIVTEEKDFCEYCGHDVFVRVDGNPEEYAGWECANCGRGFIQDTEQPAINYSALPYSETMIQ
jgi:DNA-directed RNA polymerase subunit RPC12/RpoP